MTTNRPAQHLHTGLSAAFWLFLFTYLWRHVDLRAFYFGNGIIMNPFELEMNGPFIFDVVRRPAGLVALLHATLTHSFFIPWLGASLLTLCAWCFARLGDILADEKAPGLAWPVRFIPACTLLNIYARSDHNLLDALLATLVVLALSAPVRRIMRLPHPLQALLLCAACWLAWWLAGWVVLVFVLITALQYAVRSDRTATIMLVVLMLSTALVWTVGPMVFDQVHTIDLALIQDRLLVSERPVAWFFALHALLVLGVALLRTHRQHRVARRPAAGRTDRRKQRHAPPPPQQPDAPVRIGKRALIVYQVLAVGAAGYAALVVGRDAKPAIFCRLIAQTMEQRWTDVLTTTTPHHMRSLPLPALNVVSRALYHQDSLLHSLFNRVPPVGAEAITLQNNMGRASLGLMLLAMDQYMHLGALNLAEKLGHEALENIGTLPHILERLALILVAKDNPASARIYLGQLRRQPFFAGRADSLLVALDNDEKLSGHELVSRMRSSRETADYLLLQGDATPVRIFQRLLVANPANRMAFEYLMAAFLLERMPELIVPELYRLEKLGYRSIPPLLEQAMLIHMLNTAQPENSWTKLPLSQSSGRLFEQFSLLYARSQQGDAVAQRQLSATLGTTYFHFYALGPASGGAR